MENIKTTNLISTPNIEGNIGTCTIQSNSIKIGNSFFTETYQAVQINSCNGNIINQYSYTEYRGVFGATMIGLVSVILIICFIVTSYVDNNGRGY